MLLLLKKYRALIVLTLLTFSMWLFRVNTLAEAGCSDWYSIPLCPRLRFGFLLWNIYLAWIPVLLLELPTARSKHQVLRWPILLLAILFFPNAPYLITDLIHLKARAGVPLWYDALLLFSFAYLGLMLGLRALSQIRAILREYHCQWVVEVVTVSLFLLSGLGIYLGRVLRWNSWDAILDPQGPVTDVIALFKAPVQHYEAWLMIGLFSTLLACVYWLHHDTFHRRTNAKLF